MIEGAELRDLVRQIRNEIEWAQRIGLVVEPPRQMPQLNAQGVVGGALAFEEAKRRGSPRAQAPRKDDAGPKAKDAPPPKREEPRAPEPPRPSHPADRGPPSEEALAARAAARAKIFGEEGPRVVPGLAAMQAAARGASEPARASSDPASSRAPDFLRAADPPRVVEPPRPLLPSTSAPLVARPLEEIRAELGDCTRCKLSRGRKNIVFGVGPAKAELMFIGEGPGHNEDLQGIPFVGDAGQLLTKIIEAMGFARDEVYIANVVKCRPPNNRDPEPDEVESCEPFLQQQIASVQPRILVTLGKWASQTILRTTTQITRLRGQWGRYQDIPVMPTYHPAYLLRNPAEKRPVWSDMRAVVAALGRSVPERGGQG